jgi:hypothetical protein
VKKHRQKIHNISREIAYNSDIKRVIKTDVTNIAKDTIQQIQSTYNPEDDKKQKNSIKNEVISSMRKRKSEFYLNCLNQFNFLFSPQISVGQTKYQLPSANNNNSYQKIDIDRSLGYQSIKSEAPPMSAPPFLRQKTISTHYSYQPYFDPQRYNFDPNSPTHYFGSQFSPNAASNSGYLQRSWQPTHPNEVYHPTSINQQVSGQVSNTASYPLTQNFTNSNQTYCGPSQSNYLQHNHPQAYSRPFFSDSGNYITPMSGKVPDYDYWMDFEQIKSNMDKPFVNRSKDDDLQMAKIVADLKRSTEHDQVADSQQGMYIIICIEPKCIWNWSLSISP